jgi:glycosyltransferase involved in cell wall biosynthesis
MPFKTLFLTAISPWPPHDGTSQRTNMLLRALAQCGSVDMLLTPQGLTAHAPDVVERLRRDFHLAEYLQTEASRSRLPVGLLRPLAPLFRPIYGGGTGLLRLSFAAEPPLSLGLQRALSRTRYDVIVVRYLRPAARFGAFGFAPLIVDVDDIDTERCRTQLRAPGTPVWARWILRKRLAQLEREVPPLLQRAQHLWVCSREDRAFVPADNVSILPNIPFVAEGGEAPGTPAPPPEEPRLLMVGALKYVVNERGVDRFLSATWPAVRAAHPRARFRIVGSGMSGLQRARWRRSAGVEPVGFVEDLAREYAQASFTVVPLFEGGGTKIKALESLLHGRACVVTSHVERGFAPFLVHGESLWVAKDEHAFAEGCIELLGDRTRCDALATRGREQVLKHFSFPAFAEIVRNTLERLSARFPGGVQVVSDARP